METFRALVISAALPLSLVTALPAYASTRMPDEHGVHGLPQSLPLFDTIEDGGDNWRWD